MQEKEVMLITGTRKGIGRYLAEHYVQRGYIVYGCSRQPAEYSSPQYHHFCLDVSDEKAVREMLGQVRDATGRLDVLINNAGTASMNHFLLTPIRTVAELVNTNFVGTFLFCREAAKIMIRQKGGRIVNFGTVATPMKLEGEAVYAASKAAVVSFTEVLARELGAWGITVNTVGPTPVETDLIRSVPKEKIKPLIDRQAIKKMATEKDVANVVDFFIRPESEFVTGQVIYLGGF